VSVSRTIAAGLAVSLVLLGCSTRRDARIVDAVLEGDRTLVLNIDACNADDNRTETTENGDTVTIAVTTDDPPGGDDCADGVTVELADPLGDRALIDASTGEQVEVRTEP
jgi:uncharacterized lipoprotein NlpE involved in copper resistance